MEYFIVGLGNPGDEYRDSRHNAGRLALELIQEQFKFPDWMYDKKLNALMCDGKIARSLVKLMLPETFMNNSGRAVKPLIKSQKAAERLIVVYDEIDLPLGKAKMSFGRSSGGHKGVESIIRAVGTKDFLRVRIGIAPMTASGKIKKPQGEQAVVDYVLGKFSKRDLEKLEPALQRAIGAIEVAVKEGREKAMGVCNSA
jgi:PTH1 family peptidyl-tRNA hydrolase